MSAHFSNKTYHLALIALPLYRVKYEQAQFCKKNFLFYLFSRNEKDITVISRPISFCKF